MSIKIQGHFFYTPHIFPTPSQKRAKCETFTLFEPLNTYDYRYHCPLALHVHCHKSKHQPKIKIKFFFSNDKIVYKTIITNTRV